jgi:hypothetical protein
MSEAKFQIGDAVYHKASGERGVVADMAMRCTVHPLLHSAHVFGGNRGECEYVFAGTYDLSVGLGRVMEGIDEDVLKLGRKIGESNADVVWHSVNELLPEDDERVLIATPTLVLIGTKKGMTRDAKYWSRLPIVPQP